mgnify:CR=1 FL=1
MFVFDKNIINVKTKERQRVLESVQRHVELIKNMQKYSTVCLKLVLTAKENRLV